MDIKKYKNKKFHDNPSINKKIEALFLLFDKRAEDLKLRKDKEKIALINIFIANLTQHEEYEVARAFKDRKIRIYKERRILNGRKMTIKLFLRLNKFKLSRFFRNLFK
jgi:hypothetical protein